MCEKEQNFEISSVVEAITIFREYEFESLSNKDLDVAHLPALAKMKFSVKALAKIFSSRLMDERLNANETSKKLLEMVKELWKSEIVFSNFSERELCMKYRADALELMSVNEDLKPF